MNVPDFDPSKILQGVKDQLNATLIPLEYDDNFNIRCQSCNSYANAYYWVVSNLKCWCCEKDLTGTSAKTIRFLLSEIKNLRRLMIPIKIDVSSGNSLIIEQEGIELHDELKSILNRTKKYLDEPNSINRVLLIDDIFYSQILENFNPDDLGIGSGIELEETAYKYLVFAKDVKENLPKIENFDAYFNLKIR